MHSLTSKMMKGSKGKLTLGAIEEHHAQDMTCQNLPIPWLIKVMLTMGCGGPPASVAFVNSCLPAALRAAASWGLPFNKLSRAATLHASQHSADRSTSNVSACTTTRLEPTVAPHVSPVPHEAPCHATDSLDPATHPLFCLKNIIIDILAVYIGGMQGFDLCWDTSESSD